ncbi:hypothetical protein CRM22_007657 [Opisthorchis felineus]|uniref:Uncharacterized protein n=1 Tax=Opisthorchis felineus TaxID=147828 RepID=A0A4S2LF93_OPIFE|nr:hypothetical protein CRM22_007657 [Opisthorchis felineus]
MVSSDRPVKIVVLGDGMVGKTCLLMTYTSGHYPSEYVPTVFENYLGSVKVDGKALAFELWDTAGQEEYSHLRPLSYPNTDVIILCFSIVRLSSLENAEKKWCREISQSEHLRGKPIILVGTMSDLREEVTKVNASSVITYEKAKGFAKRIGAVEYLECSALRSSGVNEVFNKALQYSLTRRSEKKSQSSRSHCTVL